MAMPAVAGALASITAHEQAETGASDETGQNQQQQQHPRPGDHSANPILIPETDHHLPTTTSEGIDYDYENSDELQSLITRPTYPNNARVAVVRSASPAVLPPLHQRRHHHHPHHHHAGVGRRLHHQHKNSEPSLNIDENEKPEEEEDGYTTSQSQRSDNVRHLLPDLSSSSHQAPNFGPIHQTHHQRLPRTPSGTRLMGNENKNSNPTTETSPSTRRQHAAAMAPPWSNIAAYYLPTSIRAEGYAPSAFELADLPPLGSPVRAQHVSGSSHHSSSKLNLGVRSSSDNGGSGADDAMKKPTAAVADGDLPHTIPHSTSFTDLLSRKQRLFRQNRGGRKHSTYYQIIPTTEEPDNKTVEAEILPEKKSSAGLLVAPLVGHTQDVERRTSTTTTSSTSTSPSLDVIQQQQPKKRASFMPFEQNMPSKCRTYHRLLHQHSGHYNMIVCNVPHRKMRLIYDIWNTLVDLKWRDIILLFLMSYFVTWLFFGLLYWLVALMHGDLDAANVENTEWSPCVLNLNSFTTAYLFSFESQHTIGYGFRHITDQCAEAIIILCFQSALGAGLQAFMVGLVFTRIQRPTRRAQTLLFSKHVCVCTRDGQLCLLFRIGNMRRSLIIHSRVTAHLVHHRKTLEGELLPLHQHELYVQLDSMSSNSIAHHHLAWPMTACHIINPESPLYDMDKEALAEARFELIVTLEGVIESTGQALEARMSYLPNEILWGFRFAPLLSYRLRTDIAGRGRSGRARVAGQYVVNFEHFNELEAALQTPTCSAAQLETAKRTELVPVHIRPSSFLVPATTFGDEDDASPPLSAVVSPPQMLSDDEEPEKFDEQIAREFGNKSELSDNDDKCKQNIELLLQKPEYFSPHSSSNDDDENHETLAKPTIIRRRRSKNRLCKNSRSAPSFSLFAVNNQLSDERRLKTAAHNLKKRPSMPADFEQIEALEAFQKKFGNGHHRLPLHLQLSKSYKKSRHESKLSSFYDYNNKPTLQKMLSAATPYHSQTSSVQALSSAIPAIVPNSNTSSSVMPTTLRSLLHLLQTEQLLTTGPAIVVSNHTLNISVDEQIVAQQQEPAKRKISVRQAPLDAAVPSAELLLVKKEGEDHRFFAERAMARRRRLGSLLDHPQYTFELQPDPTAIKHQKKVSTTTFTLRSTSPPTSDDVESNRPHRTRKLSLSALTFRRRTANDDHMYDANRLAKRTNNRHFSEQLNEQQNIPPVSTESNCVTNKSTAIQRKFSHDRGKES